MPVVVTGASGPVGKALIPRLVAAGSEVRALVRAQAYADRLRELGAKVAVGDATNPDLLPTVLRDAHTLCHLVDGLFLAEEDYFPTIAGATETIVMTAKDAELSRILFLSYPGADPASSNAYLRAMGIAEEAVRASSIEHFIVRSTLILARDAPWPAVLGPGSQRVAPVFVGDLVGVLAEADDRAQPVNGTFGMQGSDAVTARELAALLGRRGRVRLRKPRISPSAAEVLASDSLADAPDAAAEFGVKLTPLRQALQASGFIAM